MDALSLRSAAPQTARAAAAPQSLDQADFLRLLTSQLTSQSPLDPMDNEAFVAQMAQFSTVSGIGEMNRSLQALRIDLSARRLSDAAAYIGRNAFVPAGEVTPGADGISGALDLDGAADTLAVEIRDSAGRPVRTLRLGPNAAGEVRFEWDGADETGAPATGGPFKMNASAVTGGEEREVPLYVAGRVNAVSASGNDILLDVEGVGRLPPASVFKLT